VAQWLVNYISMQSRVRRQQ